MKECIGMRLRIKFILLQHINIYRKTYSLIKRILYLKVLALKNFTSKFDYIQF